jgi:hypothetical protein
MRLDAAALRQWHLDLLNRLNALPAHAAVVELDHRPVERRRGLTEFLRGEAWLHGIKSHGPFGSVATDAIAPFCKSPDDHVDIEIDLRSRRETGAQDAPARPCWRVLFNGQAGEAALIDLLIAGQAPHVEIVDGQRVVAEGRLGTEYGGVLLSALSDVLSRLLTLIVAAMTGGSAKLPALPDSRTELEAAASLGPAGLAKALLREVAGTVLSRVYQASHNTPHWRVGWRRLDGPDLFDLKRHPDGGWTTLPDDGERFYADPFPILHDGKVTLFVEDYVHKAGKGIISAVAFGPDGPIGTPTPVLEQDVHLSYPFVFERDGQIWMVPESCQAGRVDLYRATAFPGGWIRETTLLDDIVASDATLIEHKGRWWMFATVRDGGGAYSDALHIWSAPDFRGPFTPHPHNPVLIDIASARPAGRMIQRDGKLLRPVQDCRRGYGKALGLARVTRLDLEGYEQSIDAIVGPGPLWTGRRLHTLNRAGGLEFIDGSAMARRRFLRSPF